MRLSLEPTDCFFEPAAEHCVNAIWCNGTNVTNMHWKTIDEDFGYGICELRDKDNKPILNERGDGVKTKRIDGRFIIVLDPHYAYLRNDYRNPLVVDLEAGWRLLSLVSFLGVWALILASVANFVAS